MYNDIHRTHSQVPTMTQASELDKQREQKLVDFLCFAVYSANLTFGKAYKPILDQLGLTYTQYIAIVALWEENDQTVTELGEKLFLESNTLTPMLKKLEGMGYVRRERDASNERHVRVRLTTEGRSLREKAFEVTKSLFDACGLTNDEFDGTRESVVKVRDNLVKSIHM
jgi:DNA-binding MarR family transcriptional regulator